MEKVISSIEIQKRNDNRVNIYIDGEFAFSCSTELVFTHNLKEGKAASIDELMELVNEDNYLKCKSAALKIIEKSYKSEKEVFDKLKLKGYDEKTISKTMAFLADYNFINDENYAAMYIKDKIKSQGRNKIKHALLRKGIDESVFDEKLKSFSTEEEMNTALKLSEKKYKILIKTEKDMKKIYKKLWEYLMRNGYSSDIIEEALNKAVDMNEPIKAEEKVETSLEEIYELAVKRYNVISKSEKDNKKLYKKLSDYLLRRGYPWEQVKTVLKQILNNELNDGFDNI